MIEIRGLRLEPRGSIRKQPILAKLPSSNQGIVALITTIVVSLLLVVITSSAIALMSNELRQATDFDQSVKAYYAAEAGAEDAIAYVRDQLAAGKTIDQIAEPTPDCAPHTGGQPNLSGDPEATISYTCQIISKLDNEISGELVTEESIQIDTTGIDHFNRIRISWNQRGTSDPQIYDTGGICSGLSFPPYGQWDDNCAAPGGNLVPAVIEATLIIYPKTASFSEDQITTRTVILKPNATGVPATVDSLAANKLQLAECDKNRLDDDDYDCRFEITGFNPVGPPGQPGSTNHNYYVLRLHARYGPTNYRIKAFQGAVREILIPNSHIVIDATGKAGDVLRRVRLQAPFSEQPFVNFVLLADENICKLLEVTDPDSPATDDC